MKNKIKEGNIIFGLIIVIQLIAYFTASVTGNESASSVIVNAGEVGTVTYNSGDTLNFDNALPGEEKSITFSIQTTKSDVEIPYSIYWHINSNNFIGNDLVYTLTKQDSSASSGSYAEKTAETPVPSSGTSNLIASGKMPKTESTVTHNYKLVVHFKETGTDQNSNQGKSFSGKVEVKIGTNNNDSSSELYYDYSNQSGTTTAPSSETAD